MNKYIGIIILCISVFLISCTKQIEPISLHKENSHYFMFRGKPAVLLTSGEHYGAVINLDFNYVAYLDELQSKGLNCTRTSVGPYIEFPGWFRYTSDQPQSPAAGRYICPWARSSEPGYINGGNKFDLTKWDSEYFRRLKDFIAQASSRGIVVELILFCPYYNTGSGDVDLLWKYSPFYSANNINGVGAILRTNALTLDNGNLLAVQEAYVRKIVNELKDYDNLIYELCNEPYIQDLVPNDWMVHISKIIENTESTFRYKHLMSQNIANGSSKIENPVPNVSVFNFHYSDPKAVSFNYGLNKVIGNNETDGFKSNNAARVNAWKFIIGGGGLFNNLDMSFTTSSAKGGTPDSERAILRSQLSILKKFIEGFDFVKMKPDSTVIKGESLPGVSAQTLVESGAAYAIYLVKADLQDMKAVSVELKVNLPSGNYSAEWVNPVTGKVDLDVTFEYPGGEKKLSSPYFNTDVALEIKQK